MDTSPRYGAYVAVDNFYSALLQHGSWDRYEFYSGPSTEAAAARRIADLRPDRARVIPFEELRARSGDLGISAWHAMWMDGMVPFYLRDRYATRAFPVTLVHHTVSYQASLHSRFLPLLLAGTLPCDSIVCPSLAARQAVQNLIDEVAQRFNARYGTALSFDGRLDTIPLGIDAEWLKPSDQETARRQLLLPIEPLIILWLGRISAVDKADLSPLLIAFSDVVQYLRALGGGSRPILLVLAGADPRGERAVLEHQARALGVGDMVRIHTHVDAFRKAAFYGAADIFVAPTDNVQETFGLTPVEAMACGLPQVVADWDGYRDTVVHEETGLLVPTLWMDCDRDILDNPFAWEEGADHAALAQSVALDPTALRSALIKLVLNDELRRRMAAASRRRAEERFAWPQVISQYERLWAELHDDASTLSAPSPAAPDYREPFFFRAFQHYASRVLESDQQIRLTTSGAAALDDHRAELARDSDGVDPTVLRLALDLVADGPIDIAELVRQLQAKLDGAYGEPQLRRQAMRLLKYGYAQLV